MKIFKPTYLCIKRHSVTGLKYLCKTTMTYEKMLKYRGSGKYWKTHLKIHERKYVETPWFCLFEEKEELTKFALMCSKQWDIVKSNEWANLKHENGLDGGGEGQSHSDETRQKQAYRARKRKRYTCQHCGLESDYNHISRWHGDSCKTVLSEENIIAREKIFQEKYGVEKILCVYCNKKYLPSRFKERHGDNCSHNPANIEKKQQKHEERKNRRVSIICEYCSTACLTKTNYLRWHGANCKYRTI